MSAEATAARHGSLHPSDDGGRGDGDDGGIVEVGRFVVDRRVAGPGRSLLAKSPPTCTADRAGPVRPGPARPGPARHSCATRICCDVSHYAGPIESR